MKKFSFVLLTLITGFYLSTLAMAGGFFGGSGGGGGGSGITNLNSLTDGTQSFASSSSGNDFSISSSSGTHTFAIPTASATARGLISTGAQTLAGVKTLSSAPVLSALTASQAVVTDAGKALASLAYTDANTASTLVQRDASGNFSAGTISAALTGNASTATALAANPADCSANQFATTIAANGDLTCTQPSFSNISGTLGISAGGTGQTTAQAAIDALLPSQASANGKYLTSNGTTASWATVSSSGVTGPGSSTDKAFAIWSGTGGNTLADSSLLTDFSGDPRKVYLASESGAAKSKSLRLYAANNTNAGAYDGGDLYLNSGASTNGYDGTIFMGAGDGTRKYIGVGIGSSSVAKSQINMYRPDSPGTNAPVLHYDGTNHCLIVGAGEGTTPSCYSSVRGFHFDTLNGGIFTKETIYSGSGGGARLGYTSGDADLSYTFGDISTSGLIKTFPGGANRMAKVGAQVIKTNATAADSATGSETTLMSHSVNGGTLTAAGQTVNMHAVVTFAANGNNKQLKCYWDTTAIFDTGTTTLNNKSMDVKCACWYITSTTGGCTCNGVSSDTTNFPAVNTYTDLSGGSATNFAATKTIACKGTAATANADVSQKFLKVWFDPDRS